MTHTVLFVYPNTEGNLKQGVFQFTNMTTLASELSTMFAVDFSKIDEHLYATKDDEAPAKITVWAESKDDYINAIEGALKQYLHESCIDTQKFYLFEGTATSLGLTLGGWEDYEELYLAHH